MSAIATREAITAERLKFCADCAFCHVLPFREGLSCLLTHDRDGVNLVTGAAVRFSLSAYAARSDAALCGRAGRWFEPKQR